jgi:hypothetical protein
VIDIETALLQQFLNIAQRKRIAKIPPDRTKYEAGFGLPPFEDRGSGYHFAILSRHQPAALKVATHPFLFCYGHSVAGQTENYAYVGMYWTWGKDKDDKKETPNEGYFPGQLNGSTF